MRRSGLPALLAAGALALFAGHARAVTSPDFTYSAFQPGYLQISPLEMEFIGSVLGKNYTRNINTGLTSDEGCFTVPMSAPQGAWLYSAEITYATTHLTSLNVRMIRASVASGQAANIINQAIGDTSGTKKKATFVIANADHRLIKNDLYSYGFTVCLTTGDVFYGARVLYHYNSAGD